MSGKTCVPSSVVRLAERILARECEVLASYERCLTEAGSALVRDQETTAETMAQARSIVRAVALLMTNTQAQSVEDVNPLSWQIGTHRAAARTHPTESLRAAGMFVESVMNVALECEREVGPCPESFGAFSLYLMSTVLDRLQSGAASYAEFLLGEVCRANEHERCRIARELHDRVGHSLSAAHRLVEVAQIHQEAEPGPPARSLDSAALAVAEALETTRQVAADLRLDPLSAPMAEALIRVIRPLASPQLQLQVRVNGDEAWMPAQTRDEVFLILREAMRNAVRHSEASMLRVCVDVAPHEVRASVADDGVGFHAEAADSFSSGIRSMQERAELLGGSVRVWNRRGDGSQVELIVPVTGNHRAAV